jgi:hypothetical protein
MRALVGAALAVGTLALAGVIAGSPAADAIGTRPDRVQDAKKDATPKFKSVWEMELPDGTQRVAIADVTEDKKPRLLVLDKGGTLTVQKLTDNAAATEGSIALGKEAARFVTGHFAKGKPALIVLPGAVFYKDGDKYSKKELADLTEVTGSAQFIDGTEVIFVLSKNAPPTSYAIDLAAEKPLSSGQPFPQPDPKGGQFRAVVAHLPPEMLEQESFPEPVKRGMVARLFDPVSDNRIFGLFAWQEPDGPYVALLDAGAIFPQPVADTKPLWKSPKLTGKVLDIALGPDPKGSKQTGFMVLESTGEAGKGRKAEFFAVK